MSRGFLSGVAIGAVVSGLGLAGLSVLAPLPERVTSGQMAADQTPEKTTEQIAQPSAEVTDEKPAGEDAKGPEASGNEESTAQTPAVTEPQVATSPEASGDAASDPASEAPSDAMAESPKAPAAPKEMSDAEAVTPEDADPVTRSAQSQLQQGGDTALETAPVEVPTGPAAQAEDSISQLSTPEANQSDTPGDDPMTAEPAPNLADPAKIPQNGDQLPTAPTAQTDAPAQQEMASDERDEDPSDTAQNKPAMAETSADASDEGPQADPTPGIKSAPVAPIGNLAKNVTTGRLPTIGADSSDAAPADQAAPETDDQSGTELPADEAGASAEAEAQEDAKSANATSPRAIERNAISFTHPGDDRPFMAVLLQDMGAERSNLTGLSTLPFPLTVVVGANAPDAEEAIAFYKNVGAEVIVEASLPPAATPTDAEVNFQVQQDVLDQGAAVMMALDSGFQEDAPLAKHVSELLLASGHGLVSHAKGLNTGHRLAIKAGVPSGTVFRDVDGAGQDGRAIRRFLDNAAFKARQRDGVIVFGRARPSTLQALIEWSLGNRAKSVALAPVSAVLLGKGG